MPVEPKVQIRALGASEALKVLQGLERKLTEAGKAARKAAQDEEKAAKAANEAQKKAAREAEARAKAEVAAAQKAAAAQTRASAQAAAAAEKARIAIEKSAQREADRYQQLALKSLDVRRRAEEEATRKAAAEAAKRIKEAEKSAASEVKARQDAWRKSGGFLMGATGAIVAGATVAAGTARGIAGVKDVRERITSANEFRERLIIATSQAGMNREDRAGVQARVLAASRSTGKDIGELMGVLETGQAQFNNLKFFADNIEEIATISKASGADTAEFAKALGSVQQAFGLNAEETMKAAYLMKGAADKGSVELKNFATDFASTAGLFAMNTKQTGIAGVQQFLGVSQGVATGQFGSAQSATRVERFITDLNDVKVAAGLKKIGVTNIADATGKIDVAAMLDKLAGNKKFAKASVRQGIFQDVRGLEAVESLLAARQRVKDRVTGAVDMRSIAAVTEEEGKKSVSDVMTAMQDEGFLAMQQEAADMQAKTVENLRGYNDQILAVAGASDRLEDAFGRLALWANAIAAAGVVGGAAGMLGKLAGGAGTGAAAASGGSALAKALPSVANAGSAIAAGGAALLAKGSLAVGAAGGALVAGASAAGAALGYGAGTLGNHMTGWFRRDEKKASDLLSDLIFEAVHAGDARFQKGARTENALGDGTHKLVTVMEDNNKKLERVAVALQARDQKPGQAPAAREPR